MKSVDLIQFFTLKGIERLEKFDEEELSTFQLLTQSKKLKSDLYEIRGVLREAMIRKQEVELDKEFLDWLDRVEEVCQDVDDLMDELDLYHIKFDSARLSSETVCLIAWFSELRRVWGIFRKGVNIWRSMENLTAQIQFVNLHLPPPNSDHHCRYVSEELEEPYAAVLVPKLADYSSIFAGMEEVSLVGMEDQKAELTDLLLGSKASSKILSICGIGGIGKTTLSRLVMQRQDIRSHFEKVAFVTVGNKFRTRNVWLDLVQQLLGEGKEEVVSLPDLDMAQKIYETLKPKRYLIVMDDVWSIDAWECLSIIFPTAGEASSRVLLTTRDRQVAEKIAAREDSGCAHQMRGLTKDEGLELLSKITAFRGSEFDLDFPEIASIIVSHCQGLPLAIRAVGGVLATKPKHKWKMVMRHIDYYQLKGQSSPFNSLAFVYDSLPSYLKACFLYLAMFPEDSKIETDMLYSLWLAEGLIPSNFRVGEMSMMDVAECFLYELWIRNMVVVQKEEAPAVKRFKSCHLHDLVHELCLFKCQEENFCDVIYFRRANRIGLSSPSQFSSCKIHRLALCFEDGCVVPLHWNTNKYHQSPLFRNTFGYEEELIAPCKVSDDPVDISSLRVLCLYGYNFEVLTLPSMKREMHPLQTLSLRELPLLLSDLSNLKRLRVLVFAGFNFDIMNLPTGIEELLHLRYLSLRGCNIMRLPSSVFFLLSLVTLDLRVRHGIRLVVPNQLQNLQRLRYLYLPHSFVVCEGDKLELDTLTKLETLVNFDSRSCRVDDLFHLIQLRKLVARVSVSWSVEDLGEIIKCMSMSLDLLSFSSIEVRRFGSDFKEKLPLTSKLFGCLKVQSIYVEGPLEKLPVTISESLTKIHFSGSLLEDDPIKNLEKLPILSELVLHNAYLGKSMTCSTFGMPQLKRLTLSDLPTLENLTIRKGGMEKLNFLAFRKCIRLMELPHGLSFLTNLQQLSVTGMSSAFMDSLRKERVDFNNVIHAFDI